MNEIRKQYFSTPALLAVTFLGGMGLLFCYVSGLFEVRNFDMLYECIYEEGIAVIFGIFFFCISIYCWILFFKNIIIKPKKEILYLEKKKEVIVFLLIKKVKLIELMQKTRKTRYTIMF